MQRAGPLVQETLQPLQEARGTYTTQYTVTALVQP
jgi:hypothetical protein